MFLASDIAVKFKNGTVKTLEEVGEEVGSLAPNTTVKVDGQNVDLDDYIKDVVGFSDLLTPVNIEHEYSGTYPTQVEIPLFEASLKYRGGIFLLNIECDFGADGIHYANALIVACAGNGSDTGNVDHSYFVGMDDNSDYSVSISYPGEVPCLELYDGPGEQGVHSYKITGVKMSMEVK